METTDDALKEKIKGEINKCGLPLEIFVIEECSKKNTGRIPNYRYTYDEKLREIDLNAHFEDTIFELGGNPQDTTTNLIIECKKSINYPWVFFSLQMYEKSDLLLFLQYNSTFDIGWGGDYHNKLISKISPLLRQNQKHHYAFKTTPKCVSYFEAFKDIHTESAIYTAIDSVLSFLNYSKNSFENRFKYKKDCMTFFYYPIIVLQGKLFEAQIREGNVEVIDRDHIQIRIMNNSKIYAIDVVTKEYFPKFFEILAADHIECMSAISKIRLDEESKKEAIDHFQQRYKKYINTLDLK